MRWEGERQSSNVEDRRGAGGFGGGFGLGGRSIGIGSVVVALLAGWLFGVNPLAILGLVDDGPAQVQAPAHAPPPGDKAAAFVSTVLASTEDVWTAELQPQGGYQAPKLVLFRGATPTACGQGRAAMGPFYCLLDRKVYIDLDFFNVLSQRLGAPGDFAQAYVVAHEVGHHVQTLLGITERADALRQRGSQAQSNAISVRIELQADCLAGLWAQRSQQARQWLEAGDVEEALNAASRIGEDTLQRRSQGTVVPETFTHGTSAQRVAWFRRGMQGGRLQSCDTFNATDL
jgi:predicted metalloprotease